MTLHWEEIATFTGVGTTYAACTGSPYTPNVNGRLRAIKLAASGQAATSLLEGLDVKITAPGWGVDLTVGAGGGGLRTAPAVPVAVAEFEVDLPVKTGVALTIQAKWNVTAVTPNVSVFAAFEW